MTGLWIDSVRQRGVAEVARTLGHDVADTHPPTLTPCPACGAQVRSLGETSGRPDGRRPVRLSRDGLLWHCHAGACKVGGDAIAFASYALFGRPSLPRGDAGWSVLRQRLGAGSPRPAPAVPIPLRSLPVRPPVDEVRALWQAAGPLAEDPHVARWATGRKGIDLLRLDLSAAARVLPPSAPCPTWARRGGRGWSRSGHRLLLPLVDARGALRSLRARQLDDAPPKELAPTGFDAGGLVAACPRARRLLSGTWPDRTAARERTGGAGLVIVEGTPAFWGWLCAFSEDDGDAPAVIGISPGAWTREHADIVAAAATSGSVRVVLDVDPDAGGERLARGVLDTLGRHLRAGTVRLERRARSSS